MRKLIVLLSLTLFSFSSHAFKECLEEINSVYVGDGGYLWVSFIDGGLANMSSTDVDFKNTLTLLLSAKMAGRQVTMRYTSDSATCSDTRSDIRGVWIK
jgi:hypothetical protein